MAAHKFSPPAGQLPVLQYMTPGQLSIDPAYQRRLDAKTSQKLIHQIAENWDWSLCLPLVVTRRAGDRLAGGGLFVVDGQHRHAAANLRGDIQVLPCVILEGSTVEIEARLFVRLNKQRRPISKLDEFRAAIAAGDERPCEIEDALHRAGLKLAPNTNPDSWKPGELANVGGLALAWKMHGATACSFALEVLARAYPGEVLRFGGTIFPGLAGVISEDNDSADFIGELATCVAARPQADWRRAVLLYLAENPGTSPRQASIEVITEAFDEFIASAIADEMEGAA